MPFSHQEGHLEEKCAEITKKKKNVEFLQFIIVSCGIIDNDQRLRHKVIPIPANAS